MKESRCFTSGDPAWLATIRGPDRAATIISTDTLSCVVDKILAIFPAALDG
jgi:hypothetical protein